jgi:NADPH:quinone reductase
MAKIVRVHEFGGPSSLRIEDIDVGDPGPGEVRIRVGAFGLNRVEALYRAGDFGPVSFPAKIGYEAAGIIDAVGPGVSEWEPGQRVAALYGLSMERYGTYGEEILYPADMLVPVPEEQSLVDAAASWMMYGTAYALVEVADVGPGDIVIISAASSSVGIAAIQIANDHGAIAVAVTRGHEKAEALRAAGAAHVIVSDHEDLATRVMEITEGRGARIAFDAVGGAPLAGLLNAMAPLGTVIVYGMLGGVSTELMLPQIMIKNLTIRGLSADLLVKQSRTRENLIDYISSGLARGALKPVIDRVFDLSEIASAHSFLEGGTHVGKIVVTTSAAS